MQAINAKMIEQFTTEAKSQKGDYLWKEVSLADGRKFKFGFRYYEQGAAVDSKKLEVSVFGSREILVGIAGSERVSPENIVKWLDEQQATKKSVGTSLGGKGIKTQKDVTNPNEVV